MKSSDFEKTINSIQEKIGEEASSLILDDIGILLTDNKKVNEELTSRDEEITKLKKDKETLQRVNSNLLQQIPMGEETDLKPENKIEEKRKPLDFRTVFDEKRKF